MDPILRRLRESREQETAKYKKKLEDVLNNQLFGDELYVRVEDLEIVSETPTKITFKVDYQVTISIPMYDEESEREYEETEEEYRTRTLTLDKADLEESSIDALSPEDMRAELVKSGDYTKEEADDLKGLDLAKAYSGLPRKLGESNDPEDYIIEDVVDGPQGGAHVVVKDKEGNVLATYDTKQEARESIKRGDLILPVREYDVEYLDKNGHRVTATIPARDEKELKSLLSKELGSIGKILTARVSESIDTSVGSTFKNAGLTWEVLDTKGDYTLIYSATKKWHPYVVAWKLSDDGSWAQGHYFEDEEKARAYLNKKA